jgi:hypothetical protein
MGILQDAPDSDGTAPGADGSRGHRPAFSLAATALPSPTPAAGPDARSELQRRRDALAEQVTELHWDLGGLAYEMAIRDHFRLDVLVRRAAALQERDAELAELERLLRMEHEGVAGSCPGCGAPHSRGALYCWQCGRTLMQRHDPAAVTEPQAATSVMDALLANQHGSAPETPAGLDE